MYLRIRTKKKFIKEAKIVAKRPLPIELKSNVNYFWCSCGHSGTQPFCDGTHKAYKGHLPLKFKVEKDDKYFLCQCRRTSTPPYCDGSHKKLDSN